MPSVVFTGRGTLRNGEFRDRDHWTAHARRAGWSVLDKVGFGTTYLVASRTDTKKARDAQAMGVTPITYQEFLGLLLGGNVEEMRARNAGDSSLASRMAAVERAGSTQESIWIAFVTGVFVAAHCARVVGRHGVLDRCMNEALSYSRTLEQQGKDVTIRYRQSATEERDRQVAARLAASAPELRNCPDCGAPVENFFDHIDGCPDTRVIDYEVGFFRGEFTGVHGEECIVRDPNPANVIRRLTKDALDMNRTPNISWTALARRENDKRAHPLPINTDGHIPVEPPKPVAHPLGGVRRIINLDGD